MAITKGQVSLVKKGVRRIKTWRLVPLVALLCAILGSPPRPQQACGPFSQDAIFTFSVHPDFPMERYAAGQLGVIQPTYARSYLTVAYRYFAGLPLAPEEQKAAASVWADRLDTSYH